MLFTWTLLPTSWLPRRFSMISKIDCKDKKSVTNCKWYLDSHHISFYFTLIAVSELILGHRNARQEVTSRKCSNQRLWRHKAVLYQKFLNILNHPACQQTCFRYHLPHQHSPPRRQVMNLRSSRTSLSLFFLAGNIQFLSKRWQN